MHRWIVRAALAAALVASTSAGMMPAGAAASSSHTPVFGPFSGHARLVADDGSEDGRGDGGRTSSPVSGPGSTDLPHLSMHPGTSSQYVAPKPSDGTLGVMGTSPGNLTLGHEISSAIKSAHDQGQTGLGLSSIIHAVIAHFRPQARGMTVTEKVYKTVTGSVYGAEHGQGRLPGQGSGGTDTQGPQGHVAQHEHFDDMGHDTWAASSINALYQAGVVDGTSKTTFSPNAKVTGAELLTMLARLQQWSSPPQTKSTPFVLQTPAYAQTAVRSALAQGLLNGVGGLTSPNLGLTRAQAIVLLIHALGLGTEAESLTAAPIGLSGPVPSWAHGAVALAVKLGLLKGSGGKVLAGSVLSRAQMAVLLARLAVLQAQLTSASGPSSP